MSQTQTIREAAKNRAPRQCAVAAIANITKNSSADNLKSVAKKRKANANATPAVELSVEASDTDSEVSEPEEESANTCKFESKSSEKKSSEKKSSYFLLLVMFKYLMWTLKTPPTPLCSLLCKSLKRESVRQENARMCGIIFVRAVMENEPIASLRIAG